ncbi:MAG: alpha-E domain-containing protein [Verrucomicrobiaceae bacterium]|nr:alpha-E domain-containing protein [Verrucomicrobiaceae bacterium]
MLSRVADSIYWMARYMERAENLARLLMANQSLMLDLGSADDGAFWQPILMTTGDEAGFRAVFPDISAHRVQEYLTSHPGNNNSVINCIRTARENARMVRDQLTDEVWRAVNDLYLFVTGPKGEAMRNESPTDFYETIMQGSGLFQGTYRATMMRDEGWQFFQIGTYLERADKTSRLVDACSSVPLVVPPHPDARPLRWQALLRSCSAQHGYRENNSTLDPTAVLDFLFLSEQFVRSVRFCVREVSNALKALPVPPHSPVARQPARMCTKLFNDVDFATIEEILEVGIHEYIDSLQARLNAIGEALFETHVLYADLTPVEDTAPAITRTVAPLGAWHSDQEIQIQQQQQ